MNLDGAKINLKCCCNQTAEEQRENRRNIIRSFETFWDSKPSIEEFSEHTDGLLLFPEMLYMMVNGGER